MSDSSTACPACLTAAIRPHHEFRSGCQGCCARAAARGPHFSRCSKAGKQDSEYRRMLDQFGLTHDQVRAAADADALGKGRP